MCVGPTGVFTNENKVGGFEREDVRAGGGEGDAGPGVGFGHHMDGLKGWQANL